MPFRDERRALRLKQREETTRQSAAQQLNATPTEAVPSSPGTYNVEQGAAAALRRAIAEEEAAVHAIKAAEEASAVSAAAEAQRREHDELRQQHATLVGTRVALLAARARSAADKALHLVEEAQYFVDIAVARALRGTATGEHLTPQCVDPRATAVAVGAAAELQREIVSQLYSTAVGAAVLQSCEEQASSPPWTQTRSSAERGAAGVRFAMPIPMLNETTQSYHNPRLRDPVISSLSRLERTELRRQRVQGASSPVGNSGPLLPHALPSALRKERSRLRAARAIRQEAARLLGNDPDEQRIAAEENKKAIEAFEIEDLEEAIFEVTSGCPPEEDEQQRMETKTARHARIRSNIAKQIASNDVAQHTTLVAKRDRWAPRRNSRTLLYKASIAQKTEEASRLVDLKEQHRKESEMRQVMGAMGLGMDAAAIAAQRVQPEEGGVGRSQAATLPFPFPPPPPPLTPRSAIPQQRGTPAALQSASDTHWSCGVCGAIYGPGPFAGSFECTLCSVCQHGSREVALQRGLSAQAASVVQDTLAALGRYSDVASTSELASVPRQYERGLALVQERSAGGRRGRAVEGKAVETEETTDAWVDRWRGEARSRSPRPKENVQQEQQQQQQQQHPLSSVHVNRKGSIFIDVAPVEKEEVDVAPVETQASPRERQNDGLTEVLRFGLDGPKPAEQKQRQQPSSRVHVTRRGSIFIGHGVASSNDMKLQDANEEEEIKIPRERGVRDDDELLFAEKIAVASSAEKEEAASPEELSRLARRRDVPPLSPERSFANSARNFRHASPGKQRSPEAERRREVGIVEAIVQEIAEETAEGHVPTPLEEEIIEEEIRARRHEEERERPRILAEENDRARHGRKKTKKTKIVGGRSDAMDALFNAVMQSDGERARWLLARNVSPNVDTHWRPSGGLADKFLPNKVSLLHIAAAKDDSGIVKALIEHGAKIEACDAFAMTPLQVAAGGDSVGALEMLLLYGANTSVLTKAQRRRSAAVVAVLQSAAQRGRRFLNVEEARSEAQVRAMRSACDDVDKMTASLINAGVSFTNPTYNPEPVPRLARSF